MTPTTYRLRDGQQITVTPLRGDQVDMRLVNANGETTATVRATCSEASTLISGGRA